MMMLKRMDARYVVPVVAVLLIVLVIALSGRRDGPEPGATTGAGETAPTTWICPMHPQIQQPEPGDCPICGMDLVPIETEEEEDEGERRLTVSEAGRKLMEIRTSPVERKSVGVEVRLLGRVDYDEGRVSRITAWVPGRLERLHVDSTGDVVQAGDPMVDLFGPALVAAQEEIIQSSQALRRAEEGGSEAAVASASATLEAVRERLRLWGLSDEQIRGIEARGSAESHITILAPSGGTVIEKNATEGMYVSTGTVIYTIADLSIVWVELDAYESDLALLAEGQHVEFEAEAYPGEPFEGRVAFIDPVLDRTTRTVTVRVETENEGGRLKPDMFVRGVVHTTPQTHGDHAPLVIPASAALVTGKRAVVYVEVEGMDRPTFEGREVVLGARAGDYYVVVSGLAAGERVVTEGSFKIDSALQIRAKPSMMNPEGEDAPPVEGHGAHGH
jgi:Cu(I)/Ag(I) efflux system membrane fusion protein